MKALAAQQQFAATMQKYSTASESELMTGLKSSSEEERFAATWYAGEKKLTIPPDLIELLSDRNVMVQQAARRSLIMITYDVYCLVPTPGRPNQKGRVSDFGPAPGSTPKAVDLCKKKWTEFFAKYEDKVQKLKDNPGLLDDKKTSPDKKTTGADKKTSTNPGSAGTK
jgi:hypothetical protein